MGETPVSPTAILFLASQRPAYFARFEMKVSINLKELDFPEGTKLIEVVKRIREAKKDEPMIKAIKGKTGKDHIMFVVNGRVVQPREHEFLEIQEGDDIRWIHPYFGG